MEAEALALALSIPSRIIFFIRVRDLFHCVLRWDIPRQHRFGKTPFSPQ